MNALLHTTTKSRMSWKQWAACVVAMVTLALTPLYGVQQSSGVSFAQVSFAYTDAPEPNSQYGQASLDYSVLTSSGYINIERYNSDGTPAGWVVQNMPVLAGYGLPGLSTMFDLGSPGYQTSLSAYADFSATPLTDDSTLRNQTPTVYPLGQVQNNAEGSGASRTFPPGLPPVAGAIVFATGGLVTANVNSIAPSVEQDFNQCCPAALSNSLEYLKSIGVQNVKYDNVPGIFGVPNNSRVGQIDLVMNRMQGQGVWRQTFILGKLQYLSNTGLLNLGLKHQGRFDDSNGNFISGNITKAGLTSTSAGVKPTTTFIIQQVANGADMEIDLSWNGTPKGAGHCIDVIAGGYILGVPWIAFVHDAKQGDNTKGTAFADGGYGFSFLTEAPTATAFVGFRNWVDGNTAGVRDVVTETAPGGGGN
jgi:hypothetical protein